MAMKGFPKSASLTPAALSKARCGACSNPLVMLSERNFLLQNGIKENRPILVGRLLVTIFLSSDIILLFLLLLRSPELE
jgi:hypothetical protein